MKPNRARLNGGKKPASVQSANPAKSVSGKRLTSSAGNPDAKQYLKLALFRILASNQTRFGLSVANLLQHVPAFGFTVSREQVEELLGELLAEGTLSCINELWRVGAKPEALPTLPAASLETAFQSADAMLQLLESKMITDAGDAANNLSSLYNPTLGRRLAGCRRETQIR